LDRYDVPLVGEVPDGAWRRHRFDEESMPPFTGRHGFHPGGVRLVRLLQAAFSFGGRGVCGLIGFSLGEV
jgi:hypothetical protein